MKNDNLFGSFLLLCFGAIFTGVFMYFRDGLGNVSNLLTSLTISILLIPALLLPIRSLFEGLEKSKVAERTEQNEQTETVTQPATKKSNSLMSIIPLVLAIALFCGVHKSCYVSPEERKAAVAEEKRQQLIKQQEDAKQHAELKKQEDQITAEFIASGAQLKVYGMAGDDASFLMHARRAIRQFAKDAQSVEDVEQVSKTVRLRTKDYPTCHYAIGVRFRAKNSFGATVTSEGFILFDFNKNGIAFVQNLNL